MRIALIACSGKKLSHAAPARELYQGDLFKKSVTHAEHTCDLWYVLSAKHGLVTPDQVLEPYDETLSTKTPDQRREWGQAVIAAIEERLGGPHHWYLYAGQQYVQPLVAAGYLRGFVGVPLAGKRFGEQLAWLKATTLRLAPGRE